MVQQTLALGFVVLAAGYLLRGVLSTLAPASSKRSGCAGGCGCAMKTPPAPVTTKRSLPILRQ
jgi:hypothetical protein